MRTSPITRPILNLLIGAVAALTFAGCNQPNDTAPQPVPDSAVGSISEQQRDPNRAWCAAHQAYEDLCFICNPKLREKGRLWCREHARYEDRCWLCHPDEEDKARAYCTRHYLFQDECFLCRPELKESAKPGSQAKLLQCPEHGVAEKDCAICHPELASGLAPGQSLKVRLPSMESAQMAGVEMALPDSRIVSGGVECYAEIGFNQNQVAHLFTPVGGVIQSVEADLGSEVEANQVVARVWSATIAEAVTKAVLAQQTLERERKLRAQRVTSEKDLQEAEAAHRAAWQQLRTAGFSGSQIEGLAAQPDESVLLEIRAPFSGEIVDRSAVQGAQVEAGKPLFTVANRSTMWATLNLPESALDRVAAGQKVELRIDAIPGKTFPGTLTWISAEVDDRTRLARARADVPNPDRLLRARMFARARIQTQEEKEALCVPATAVQHVDGRPFVFVRVAEDLFDARLVRLGMRLADSVEVLEGLHPADRIAVNHSYTLKSQFLLSRLGAGCVDD